MKNTPNRWLWLPLLAVLSLTVTHSVWGQQSQPVAQTAEPIDTPITSDTPDTSDRTTLRLQALSNRLSSLESQRQQFIDEYGRDISELNSSELVRLQTLDADIAEVQESFTLVALGTVDVSNFADQEEQPFNWQQELSDVAAPIIESVKGLTQKSQQMNDLRNIIARKQEQKSTAENAIAAFEQRKELPLTEATLQKLDASIGEWSLKLQTVDDRLSSSQDRLAILEETEVPLSSRLRSGTRAFVLGRGLTLLLSILSAGAAYLFMRALWWVVSNKFITKDVRRKAVWFRLASYAYALFTGLVMFAAFIAVLNLREDTLLLAIALVLVIAAVLGLRHVLPGYVQETKLLLNIGPVREDERINLNGLPWNVESLNLQTVLRNPSLNGVIRLPIADLKGLTSRPYRDKLWFPTNKGDFIILPNDAFAQVAEQTPELVQLRIRGGMMESIPTADFFAMPIINLSRGETFGVSQSFGLDYSIQQKALDTIPETLKSVVQQTLRNLGHPQAAETLIVDLEEAGASSLNFLVFARFPSKHADSYFMFQREILKACVKACNEHGWSIPFPQMVMHSAA